MSAAPAPPPSTMPKPESAIARSFDLNGRTLAIALAQGVVKLPQIAIAVVLVRLLTEAQWNTLSFALTVYLTGVGLGGLNINQSVYFFYGRVPREERRGLVLQTTALLASTAAIAALIILSLGAWLGDGALAIEPLLPMIALVVLLEVPTSAAQELLLASESPRLSAGFTAVSAVLQGVALILPIALGRGLDEVLRWLVVYTLCRLVVYVVLMLRATPPGPIRFPTAIGARMRDQIVYTLPLALAMASGMLNKMLDKWLVAAFDPVHFGAYYLSAQEVPLIPLLPFAMGAVVATRYVWAFKRGRTPLALAYWRAAVSRVAVVIVPSTAAVIICAPELFPLAFTEANAVAVLPFQIYGVILFHRVAEYGIVLRAAGDTRSLWLASLTLLGSNVLVSLPLVATLGMVGAALGTLIANAVAWIYILRRIARVMETPLRVVFPWRHYGALLALATVVGGVTWAGVSVLDLDAGTALATKATGFTVLYWLASRALGVTRHLPPIPDDDPDFLGEVM
ncbi:MAG: polysaccharide biosynthesis protein [Myxococcales bacterium]|nr:polysaccharide biosynthesis protein [Myxococcales bacterium]MCB9734812.1 polysaccharide biosynthesis protein [Deltaproteobacteria bacterium]